MKVGCRAGVVAGTRTARHVGTLRSDPLIDH